MEKYVTPQTEATLIELSKNKEVVYRADQAFDFMFNR